MGSYVAFYLAGLYPLPATKQFLLSSPYFPSISFFNPGDISPLNPGESGITKELEASDPERTASESCRDLERTVHVSPEDILMFCTDMRMMMSVG